MACTGAAALQESKSSPCEQGWVVLLFLIAALPMSNFYCYLYQLASG